ncbi:MAG: S8 family serine peptidase [Anaerolineae bacterium]
MMLARRIGKVLALLFALCLIVAPLASAGFPTPVVTDDGPAAAQPAQPEASPRLIIELQTAPLAAWYSAQPALQAAGSAKLDVNTSVSQAYIAQLKAEQASFVMALHTALPSVRVASYVNENGARVALDYQVTFNGMAVELGGLDSTAARKAISKLPGVKAVYLDLAQHTDLYTSTSLINAPAIWNMVGGQAKGGAGVKIASMDGGISHQAPMFSGEGWSYPVGWPNGGLGLTSNNNGKIIASRVYFRDWDPPVVGDDDPWPGLYGTEHGNHTSSIAAGDVVTATYGGMTFTNMSGVAPGAWLMSYRVFYASERGDGSFHNAEGIKALEDIVRDGADVLNCSWGGGPTSVGGEFDALDTALINATKAGIFVSMSNGNAGPGPGTGDHPSANYINVAASSSGGTLASGKLNVSAPEPVDPILQDMAFATAAFGAPLIPGSVLTYDFVPGESIDPTNILGCNPWPAGAFTGKAAVIQRGTCEFGVKVLNAEQAGAAFVVIRNNVAGGDTLISMGAGAVGGSVTISSVFVGYTNGVGMVNWYTANGAASQLTLDMRAFQVGDQPDVVAAFSSRGPSAAGTLKPDIAAPGVNILAQGYTPGATGLDRHLGWGQASGTSMAAPFVAGAAALVKQVHPDWSVAWIKSALMSTSKYLDVYAVDIWSDIIPAQPLDMGAGRLDLTKAADPGVILDMPSLSFGSMALTGAPEAIENGFYPISKTIQVLVTSVADTAETYTISTLDTRGGFNATTDLACVTVSPTTMTLAPGETGVLDVTMDTSLCSAKLGDYQGFIVMDGETHDAHLPLWASVKIAPAADVLIIQNDASNLLGFNDYLSYYTSTLDNLGLSYFVWNPEPNYGSPVTLPPIEVLSAFKAIIYFTGDNYLPNGYFTVSTPLTSIDMDILTQYVNNGGTLIAMGQDLASVLGASAYAPPNAGANVLLYGWVLGANYIQDSLTAYNLPVDPVVALASAAEACKHLVIDVGDPGLTGDGAGNQLYIDEIDNLPPGEPVPPLTREFQPLLRLQTEFAEQEGVVSMAHRDQPSLERPGVSYLGRSIYTSFGLEGVNDYVPQPVEMNALRTSREELLATFLSWAWDEPVASVMTTREVETSKLSGFEAGFSSNIQGAYPVSYRWDFGDGSGFVGPFSNGTAMHAYKVCGPYTVRVEIVDNFGNVAIGSLDVNIDLCSGSVIYIPLVLSSLPVPAPLP